MVKTVAISIALVPQSVEHISWFSEMMVDGSEGEARFIEERIPHLTLSMLAVDEKRIDSLRSRVNSEPDHTVTPNQTFSNWQTLPDSPVVQWLEVDKTAALMRLHRSAMELRKAYHVKSSELNYLSEGCRIWVKEFDRFSGVHYRPHFTLGKKPGNITSIPKEIPCSVKLLSLESDCGCLAEV